MTSQPGSAAFPRFRPVAAHGLLVEFGESVETAIHDSVLALDHALSLKPFAGFAEAIPAYASLMVCFDPMVTDHAAVRSALETLIGSGAALPRHPASHAVAVCYDGDFAPDLGAVATATGLSPEAVVAAHLAGRYDVAMYGFAPGYAYLAGTPPEIRLPRKETALRGVPAGSVIIAGPQCLVTTLTMPTGWWIIGRSPTRVLRDDAAHPFLFAVGDAVTFSRIDRTAFDALDRASG